MVVQTEVGVAVEDAVFEYTHAPLEAAHSLSWRSWLARPFAMQASRTASQLLIEETVPIGVEMDADGVVDEDQVVMVSIGVEIEITESE